MLSSHVLSRPSCCRILLTCRRASRSLQTSMAGCQHLLPGAWSLLNITQSLPPHHVLAGGRRTPPRPWIG
jgi:hypothetical protein